MYDVMFFLPVLQREITAFGRHTLSKQDAHFNGKKCLNRNKLFPYILFRTEDTLRMPELPSLKVYPVAPVAQGIEDWSVS